MPDEIPQEDFSLIVLNRQSYDYDISQILGEEVEWIERPFPELLQVIYSTQIPTDEDGAEYSPSTPLVQNRRASLMTKTPIYGNAIVVKGEVEPSKREVLFYMLRPEWIRKNKPIHVSSDVFTKFGFDKREVHEHEVLTLRQKLIEEQIPRFVNWATKNCHKIISAFHFPAILHEHGINLRYVGLIYLLIPEEYRRLKYSIVGVQMVARIVKNQLLSKLRARTFESMERYHKELTDYFNTVLGDSPESTAYWENNIRVQLMLKYGPFGYKYNSDSLQSVLHHLVLFYLMQEHTGVWFKGVISPFLPHKLHYRGPKPLRVEDLTGITARINRWEGFNLWQELESSCFAEQPNPLSKADLIEHEVIDQKIVVDLSRQDRKSVV